jgi:hypothetical protein
MDVILREEHRLRVFENKVPRKIFGPKRNEIIEGWRMLHNEKLHNLYASLNIIRMIKSMRMRWAGHWTACGEEERIQGFGGESRKREATRKA